MKFEIFKFDNVTSTNDIAINLIKEKNKKMGCVYADVQTSGRGTRGKKWVSNKGNLFGSIFFPLKKNFPPFNEFSVINPLDQTNIHKGMTSYQVAELLSSITDAQDGTSKWISNVSHRGLIGNSKASNITKILSSGQSDDLKISLWVNKDNQVNLIQIIGTITHDGKEFSKLHISPE